MQARFVRAALASLVILAMVSVVTIVVGGDPVSAQAVNTFSDDDGNIHEANIEFIAALGITTGCGPSLYCPSASVTRGQMAAFLKRALDLPATATDYFTDDDGTTFEDDINRLAASGITVGCTATTFCPTATVTRGQMAAFLKRGFKLGATPTDYFTDDDGTTFEDDINRLAASGITVGCTATTFCPTAKIRRDQMASFLARALTKFPTTTTTTSSTTTSSTTTSSTTTSSTTTTSTTIATNPLITEGGFGIFDDGTEDAATLNGALNRGAVIAANGTTFGVRIGVSNTGTGNAVDVEPRLQYRYIGPTSPNGPLAWSDWTNVGPAERVRPTASVDLTDDAEAPSERLAGPQTFVAGRVDEVDGAITTAVAIGPGQETEFLFSVSLAGADPTDQYQFRLVDSGSESEYDVYGVLPAVNLPYTFANGFETGVDGALIKPSDSGDPDQWSQVLAPKEVTTIDRGTATGGTFTVTVDGQTTAPIPYNATAASVKSALELLSTVVNVSVPSSGTGTSASPWVVTFNDPIQSLSVSGDGALLTAGSLTVTETQDGLQTPVYDDAFAAVGLNSALFTRMVGQPATYLRINDFNQAEHLYGRVYFRYTGTITPAGSRIVDVVGGYNNGDTQSHSITVREDGKILMTAGGMLGYGRDDLVLGPVLAADEWYRIEWHATTESAIGADDGTLSVEVYNSVGGLYASGVIANAATITEFEDADFGPRGQTITAWVDGILMSNSALPAP